MKNDRYEIVPTGGEVLIYKTDDGGVKIDVSLVNETLWMTQSDMARLFQCSPDNISLHLKNIYDEGELDRASTAEDQALRRAQIFLRDWEQKLDEFLRFNDRRVLPNAGKVSKQAAEDHAKAEYKKFAARRREHKEALGEEDYVKQLEEAAKIIDKK